jgi:hypothetical protein
MPCYIRSYWVFVVWQKRTNYIEIHTLTGNSVTFHKIKNIKLFSLFQGKYKDIKIQTCWVPSVIYTHNTYRPFITVADIIQTQGKSIHLKINRKKLVLMVAQMLEHVDPTSRSLIRLPYSQKITFEPNKELMFKIISWNSTDVTCVVQCSPDTKFSHVRRISKTPPRTMLNSPAYKFFV